MAKKLEDYGSDFESNPLRFIKRLFWSLFFISILLGLIGWGMGFFTDAGQVIKKEFAPSALLKKYEWFKDASAQLDKKQADVAVYNARLADMDSAYKTTPRNQWARDDREQHSIWQSELAGIKASYNSLAAEYNAAMAKFNYAFCNAGQMPAGATMPLPREYKPYINQ